MTNSRLIVCIHMRLLRLSSLRLMGWRGGGRRSTNESGVSVFVMKTEQWEEGRPEAYRECLVRPPYPTLQQKPILIHKEKQSILVRYGSRVPICSSRVSIIQKTSMSLHC